MKQIYLDNAATTKTDEKVFRAMKPYFSEKYGNASSQHSLGKESKDALEKSRKIIAKSLNAKTSEIYFTSGGTESNNFVLKGLFFKNQEEKTGKNHIITTTIEHDCILKSCKWLEKQGANVTYLPVDEKGFVSPEDLKKAITEKTFLVSIIHGNNEIGTIQNLEELSKICYENNVLFHTDACQSYTKTEIDVKKNGLDLVTINGHKIHGPKGIGALYIKSGIKISPLMHGGGHEDGLRSGTENIPGIVGFGEAVKIARKKDIMHMKEIQEKIVSGLMEIPKVELNGPELGDKRICNNINVSFSNIEGEAIGGYLQRDGIMVSTGSACMSHSLESSHVLKAIGISGIKSNSSLRISISKYTTEEDATKFLNSIKKTVKKLRAISPLT